MAEQVLDEKKDVYEPKLRSRFKANSSLVATATATNSQVLQEYLTWSDLSALDSSPAAIRAKFKDIYGTEPDGIALNNTTYYNAVQPPITEQYSHYCYKISGQPEYGTQKTDGDKEAIVGTSTAINRQDTDAKMTVSISGTWTDSTTVTSSITTGMSFSSKITLKGVFEMGLAFDVSTTVGESATQTTSKTQTTSVDVTVPANSEVTVNMVATFEEQEMNYTMPIQVSGSLGANFPKKVNGHYFWFNDIRSLTPKQSGEITGKIDGVMGVKVVTEIMPAKPIS